jgi:hypothetical protein
VLVSRRWEVPQSKTLVLDRQQCGSAFPQMKGAVHRQVMESLDELGSRPRNFDLGYPFGFPQANMLA